MSAMSDPLCPVCRVTVLHAVNVRTWRGVDCCMWCEAELDSHDSQRAAGRIRTHAAFHLNARMGEG